MECSAPEQKGEEMPPKARISKEKIVEASFELVRAKGHEALSARSVARQLGCSTQPILYYFHSMDEILRATYHMADDYHTAFILPEPSAPNAPNTANPLLQMGLSYVRFAHDEPHLFRFLFQTNQFGGMNAKGLVANPELGPILAVLCQALGCSEQEGTELFLTFFYVVHGMASLLANNVMDYDAEQTARLLTGVFDGVVAARASIQNIAYERGDQNERPNERPATPFKV